MTIVLRKLLLRINTEAGPFGRRLDFERGLCVVHGANASGKSTLMQGIIYALGLEGMFGPSRALPFPHAVVDSLFVSDDESQSVNVRSSEVLLELSNGQNETLTLRRVIKGGENQNLVKLVNGAVITERQPSPKWEDYYVREGGAATAPRGLHRRLPEFFGWNLPEVVTHAGDHVPLYMESLFPLLYVEQKHAWSNISGRFPGHLRIREPGKRAVEFLLGLDVFTLGKNRSDLLEKQALLKQQWSSVVSRVQGRARPLSIQVDGIPSEPQSGWKGADRVKAFIPSDSEWRHVSEERMGVRNELEKIRSQSTPTVSQATPETEAELQRTEQRARELEEQVTDLLGAVGMEQGNLEIIRERLRTTGEDLEKYTDLRKLKRMGGTVNLDVAHDRCPTCHQSMPQSLTFSIGPSAELMGIEENINYLKEQKKLFEALEHDAVGKVRQAEAQLAGVQTQVSETRRRIRALKRSLTSDDRLPSEATIARRLFLETRLQDLDDFSEDLDQQIVQLQRVAQEWEQIENRLATLPKSGLSKTDIEKIDRFEAIFVDQAEEYRIKSINPRELGIARDSYRPVYQDYDLQFDLSASDAVRATWAYMNGLLETAGHFPTNHPGILILDEPRQQSAKIQSLRDLLRRLSSAGGFHQQVVVATSEELPEVRSSLSGLPHTLLSFDGRALRPLANDWGDA